MQFCSQKAFWLVATASIIAGCTGDESGTDSLGGNAGELIVTVSGEGLGANGYPFPPGSGQAIAFVDGWDVKFDRILVTVDNIRLSEMPDKNPGNQGETGGELVRRTGPWVVDAVKPGNEIDKGGAGRVAIRLPIADFKGLSDLEQRYAFGYDFVKATPGAQRVNVDSADPDYQEMIDKGYVALLVGTATFKANDADCKASKDGYDWAKLPKQVLFRFGFEAATSYVNCQNPDNTGQAIAGEESQRGIQMRSNAPVIAQVTIHTDHVFWTKTSHGNVPMFNQFAANAKQVGGEEVVDLEGLESVPLTPVTDASGGSIPWRSCVADTFYKLPTAPSEMTFDTMGQPLTSLHDFVGFNASTMGHLNADGLCYVSGH